MLSDGFVKIGGWTGDGRLFCDIDPEMAVWAADANAVKSYQAGGGCQSSHEIRSEWRCFGSRRFSFSLMGVLGSARC